MNSKENFIFIFHNYRHMIYLQNSDVWYDTDRHMKN